MQNPEKHQFRCSNLFIGIDATKGKKHIKKNNKILIKLLKNGFQTLVLYCFFL